MPKKCYNCGIDMSDLKKENRTKEHIPARTFFTGYPNDYKDQRKTVPACRTCNEEFAKIDDQLRDVIGILNNGDPNKSELTKKSVRKILANKKELTDRITINQNSIDVTFDKLILDSLHKKNFKGIYSLIKKNPLNDDFKLDAYSAGNDEKKLSLGEGFRAEMKRMGNWEKSGHEDVFNYKITYFDLETDSLKPFEETTENYIFLVAALEYNKEITAIVVAAKPETQNIA